MQATGSILVVDLDSSLVVAFIFTVVLICVEEHLLRKVMLAAHGQGMTNGEYVFIYPNLLPSENWEQLYLDSNDTDYNNTIAMEAYKPLIQVRYLQY